MINNIFIYLYFTYFTLVNAIEFRACCEPGKKSEKCQKFSDLSQMIGLACCGSNLYNTSSGLCCDGEVHQRNRGGVMAHSCCGSQPLRLDQTCCGGVIHNIISGDCCGVDVYFKSDPALICCNNTLSTKSSADDSCCGTSSYDGGVREQCCGSRIFQLSEFDACCSLTNGKMKEYKSETHVCCDGPLEKLSKTKACCYLRKDGKFINTQYDKTKQCCKYPYDKLYPMPRNGTCL